MADSPQIPNGVPIREAGSRPKLLDQVRHTIRMRHYSRRTDATYVHWIRRFIVFHHKKHPSMMGAAEIVAFSSRLATGQRVSSLTHDQALSALLFLCYGLPTPPIEDVQVAEGTLRPCDSI